MWDDGIWLVARPAFKSSARGRSLTDCEDRPRKLPSLERSFVDFVKVCATFLFLAGGSGLLFCWPSLVATRLLLPGLFATRGSGNGVIERRGAEGSWFPGVPGALPEYRRFVIELGGFMNSGELPNPCLDTSGVFLAREEATPPAFSDMRRAPRPSFDLSDVVRDRRLEPLLGSGNGSRKVKLARTELSLSGSSFTESSKSS
jgi:hypothetical protein